MTAAAAGRRQRLVPDGVGDGEVAAVGVEDARSPSRMRGWARAILSGYPGRF